MAARAPGWGGDVRVRHLLSHTSGLPEVEELDDVDRAGHDRTTAGVLGALARATTSSTRPGRSTATATPGYVCLALVVGRVAAGPSPTSPASRCSPLGSAASRFWDGPERHPPGAVPLDPPHPAPLSVGDGGLWSSAADLLRWNLAMDRDALGVAGLVQTPGHLDDGTALDDAWGLGVREHAGRRVYRHGGRWAGLCAPLVRLPGRGSGVVLAVDDDEQRTATLTEAVIQVLAG